MTLFQMTNDGSYVTIDKRQFWLKNETNIPQMQKKKSYLLQSNAP